MAGAGKAAAAAKAAKKEASAGDEEEDAVMSEAEEEAGPSSRPAPVEVAPVVYEAPALRKSTMQRAAASERERERTEKVGCLHSPSDLF